MRWFLLFLIPSLVFADCRLFPEIPKEVVIDGIKYKVNVVDVVDKNGNIGSIDPDTKEIRIKKFDAYVVMDTTMLHEIIHGANYKLSEAAVLNLESELYRILPKTCK